jgi:hypothetical protein
VSSPIGYVQEKDLQGTFFALSQDSKIRYFSLMKFTDGYAYVCWSNSMLEFRNQFSHLIPNLNLVEVMK